MPRTQSFPAQLPEGSLQTVIGFLKGSIVDRWQVAEAAYDMLGFAMYQARGPRAAAAGVPAHPAAAHELELLISTSKQQNPMPEPQPNPPLVEEGEQNRNEAASEKKETPPQMVGALNLPDWVLPLLLQVLTRVLTT